MQSFDIDNRKDFMNKLLKSDLFDTFEVRDVVVHTAFKLAISGERNLEYFNDSLDIDSADNSSLTKFLAWGEIRNHVYNLMSGNKLPTYFKIILSTNKERTLDICPDATTLYLNITFKDNHISCGTGTAYATFTMNKSGELEWDERIKRFLFKHNFI